MTSIQALCPTCRRDLAPPDKTHRYCPFCGEQRVAASTGGPGGTPITLGCDVLDATSGDMLGYAQATAPPTHVGCLLGPHHSPEGTPWRDLFGASGMPSPVSALLPFASPQVERMAAPSEPKIMHKPLHVTARQRSFYVLLQSGDLHRLSDTNLNFANAWSFPKLDATSPASRLFTGFTLVGVISPVNQSHQISAYDLVQGKQRINLSLPYTQLDACFVGEALYVVGVTLEGSVVLECYSLAAFEHSQLAQPAWKQTLVDTRGPGPHQAPRLACLPRHLLIITPQGWVQSVPLGPVRPSEDPALLWPAPGGLKMVEGQAPLYTPAGDVYLLMQTPHHPPTLLELRDTGAPIPSESFYELGGLSEDEHPLITCTSERIYYAHKPAAGVVTISSASYERPWELGPLTTLPGSNSHRIARFEAVPHGSEVKLLLQTVPTDTDFAMHFHLVHPVSGQLSVPPVGKPSRDDLFEVAWTAGRTLLLNVSMGKGHWL